jgi:hypothetical protein
MSLGGRVSLPKRSAPPPSKPPRQTENALCLMTPVEKSWLGTDRLDRPSPMSPFTFGLVIRPDVSPMSHLDAGKEEK